MYKRIQPNCPICGAAAYLSHDVINGMDMGYSAGCSRFYNCDRVHGTTYTTSDKLSWAVHGMCMPENADNWWKERVSKHENGGIE